MDFIEQLAGEFADAMPRVSFEQDTLTQDEEQLLAELPPDPDARMNALEMRWFFLLGKLERENSRREQVEAALDAAHRRIERLQLDADDHIIEARNAKRRHQESIFALPQSIRTQLSERSKDTFTEEAIIRIEAMLVLALCDGRTAEIEQLQVIIPELASASKARLQKIFFLIVERGRIAKVSDKPLLLAMV